MIPSPIRELPPRTYPADAAIRRRWLPFGMAHPAKCNLGLVADLFRRYTLPGQTVLDPFGGIGSSLLGCGQGRNVVLVELEAKFAAEARRNAEHIRANAMPGMVPGWAKVLQADSRRIPMRSADGVIGSPPYLDAREGSPRNPSSVAGDQALGASQAQLGERDAWGSTPGQIGHMAVGNVDVAMASPPYGDLATRDRSKEPYASKDPERAARYGQDAPNRNVDGYGDHTPGQIGDLRHEGVAAAMGSPPYEHAIDRLHPQNADVKAARLRLLGMHDKATSLLRKNATSASNMRQEEYGESEGQIGNDRGETYAVACLAVYRECFRIVRPGGVLVLVTGNYVRGGAVIDLAADTIRLAEAAGWTTVERWRHDKATVSFWRRLHHQQAMRAGRESTAVTHEDVLVFVKGHQGWPFTDLLPTTMAAAVLTTAKPDRVPQPMLELTA